MKSYLIALACLLMFASIVSAASLNFVKPLPSATQGTLGANQRLEIQKDAITELRTKMQNWATFTGYSAGTNR